MKRSSDISGTQALGAYILEFAIVLPILLVLILGAFDIVKLLHAYTATRDSVNTALRCLWAADDPRCTRSTIAAGATSAVYDWFLDPRAGTHWQEPQTQYHAQAAWLHMPTFHFEKNVEVLTSVSYTMPSQHKGVLGTKYTNKMLVPTLVKIEPTLGGANPRNVSLSYQSTTYPLDSTPAAGEYSPVTKVPLSSINLAMSGTMGPQSLGVPFIVPTPQVIIPNPTMAQFIAETNLPLSSIGCAAKRPSATTSAVESQKPTCLDNSGFKTGQKFGKDRLAPNNIWDGKDFTYATQLAPKGRSNIILIIHGGTNATAEGAAAKVALWVHYLGGRKECSPDDGYHLGAQLFGGTGKAQSLNFYPRGAPLKSLSADLLEKAISSRTISKNDTEFDLYQSISLCHGEQYQLDITLMRDEQQKDWTAPIDWHGTEMYLISPLFAITATELPCATTPDTCARSCDASALKLPFPFKELPRKSEVVSRDLGCVTDDKNDATLLAANQDIAGLCAPTISSEPNCGRQNKSDPCPANLGVSSSATESEMMSACTPKTTSPLAQSYLWKKGPLTLSTADAPIKASHCQDIVDAPPPPKSWDDYKKPIDSAHKVFDAGWEQYTGEQDPQIVRDEPSSDLHCPEITIKEASADSCKSVTDKDGISRPSLFHGEQTLFQPYIEKVKQEAIACGLPAEAFFKIKNDGITSWRDVKECPSDGRVCRVVNPPPGEYTKLPGGPYPNGVKPEACTKPGAVCYPKLASLQAGVFDKDPIARTEASAVALAKEEFSVFFPAADFKCDNTNSAYCAKFEASSSGSNVSLHGKVKVPLLLLRALAHDPVEVSYSNSRTWEGEYAK